MRLGGKKRTADMQLLLDQQPQEFGEDFHRGRSRARHAPCTAAIYCLG